MADLNCEITGRPGHISADVLRASVQQTVGLLHEYDAALSGGRGFLSWNVRELKSNGSLLIGFRSDLSPRNARKSPVGDNGSLVANTLVEGIQIIHKKVEIPPYLSEFGLNRVGALAQLIHRRQADSVTLSSGENRASINTSTGESLSKIMSIRRTSIGSVEGRLVGINVTKQPKVSIVHHISKKSVGCVIDESEMDRVKDALGKRVIVYGQLHKNAAGDTVRVTMRRLSTVAEFNKKQLAGISDLPIPDFAQTNNTEEYLIQTRGE